MAKSKNTAKSPETKSKLPKLAKLDNDQLIALYGSVMAELLARGVVRSANNPIGDIAERLVADLHGVEPAPPNEKSYDVKTKKGERIQVKALRLTRKNSSGLSPIRSHDFESLVVVVFHADMTVVEAWGIPLAAVERHQGWSKTWGCHRLSLSKKVKGDPDVTRIPPEKLLAR